VTDPRGNVRRVTFNANGYALADTRAYGTAIAQTTTYTRDATSSLVTSMTDALGRQTTFTYNSQGYAGTVPGTIARPPGSAKFNGELATYA
jgi:uncharacterized protein RhaS with RHS repeats